MKSKSKSKVRIWKAREDKHEAFVFSLADTMQVFQSKSFSCSLEEQGVTEQVTRTPRHTHTQTRLNSNIKCAVRPRWGLGLPRDSSAKGLSKAFFSPLPYIYDSVVCSANYFRKCCFFISRSLLFCLCLSIFKSKQMLPK